MYTQWHPIANTNIMFEIGIMFTCFRSFILPNFWHFVTFFIHTV